MLARGLTAAKRKRAELELRQAEGELMPVQLHARALKVIVATLVANLGNIESRMAPLLDGGRLRASRSETQNFRAACMADLKSQKFAGPASAP